MERELIATPDAPRAIGPYAQAVRWEGLLFCSGQIGLDPASGALVEGGVVAQAERALLNLAAVLAAGGSSWERVLKTTIYLVSMNDFEAVNAVYKRFAGERPAARVTVAVAALPKAALVEIEATAACNRS